MNIDDIYNPAVSGDLDKLQAVLEESRGQLDINQIIDCGVVNGKKTTITLLFSVIAQMRKTKINYEILDLLIKYGADVNGVNTLDDGNEFIKVPLLAYAISDWSSLELTEYLLKNGADPNAKKECVLQRAYKSLFPMVYFAIEFQNDDSMLELLLKYNANPNGYIVLYLGDRGCYQFLPPIYYALVEKQYEDMCVALFRYGASPQITIDVGFGLKKKYIFKNYITLMNPGLSSMLMNTFELAQNCDIPVVQDVAKKTKIMREYNDIAVFEKLKLYSENVYGMKSFERCYGKFTAYLFGNFGLLTIAFMIIAPLCFIGSDPGLAGAFFLLGIPMLLISFLVWKNVEKKARDRGQVGIFGQFVLDSLLMLIIVILFASLILIPFAVRLIDSSDFETRKTTSGMEVKVRRTWSGDYEDVWGNRYSDQ